MTIVNVLNRIKELKDMRHHAYEELDNLVDEHLSWDSLNLYEEIIRSGEITFKPISKKEIEALDLLIKKGLVKQVQDNKVQSIKKKGLKFF